MAISLLIIPAFMFCVRERGRERVEGTPVVVRLIAGRGLTVIAGRGGLAEDGKRFV